MKEEVAKIIDKIRPSLQADGGDVKLVDVDDEKGIVKVKLLGACQGCPMSTMTIKKRNWKGLKGKSSWSKGSKTRITRPVLRDITIKKGNEI